MIMASRGVIFKVFIVILGVMFVSGCSVTPKKVVAKAYAERSLVVFFDGTANDEVSDTNIKKLHSLVTLQNRDDISSIYIEGVGAKGKVIGMATGWGLDMRNKLAYEFLLKNHKLGDKIFIFGFSRGAYSGRILASMLHNAGLPSVHEQKDLNVKEFVEKIYESFKGVKSAKNRKKDINSVVSAAGLKKSESIDVDVLGLWDTVEALGVPNYEANTDIPNSRYGDQLCNVKKAFHAMSIDDDREQIFTPILLTKPHLLNNCIPKIGSVASKINEIVDEVWFSGAHADVGGGYNDSEISGVSLNWMIGNISKYSLLPNNASVSENAHGISHDPENGFPWNVFYKKQSRDLRRYVEQGIYNKRGETKRPIIHVSVIERLAKTKPNDHEYQWFSDFAYPHCFEKTSTGYQYTGNENSQCFDIVM